VTNGIGGFASGTVAGIATRRYHGLLIAALAPPVERRLLVAAIDELLTLRETEYELGAHRWSGGALAPRGYRYLEHFELDGTVPVWTFACAEAQLEKRIWMEHGANRSYIRYRLLRGDGAALALKLLVNDRDFHGNSHAGERRLPIEPLTRGVRIATERVSLEIRCDSGDVTPEHVWFRDALLARETERGLDDRDDMLHAATIRVALPAGGSVTVACGAPGVPDVDADAACARNAAREADILAAFRDQNGGAGAPWIERFALAADQFVVRRGSARDAGRSIVAGYHWFGDWGRDTMIALPGITLATGRARVAATILETFAGYVDDGMLPNYFPDAGQAPEYNSVDAALWYVEAVRQYHAQTGDDALVRRLFAVLAEIVARYAAGTRFGIGQATDGLLAAGVPGVQLTWMDAKAEDWVVTPRIGKPVEVNALWYNALDVLASFAILTGADPAPYQAMREKTRSGFARFWNAERAYLYDVLDGPEGNDASLRPNAIFAAALTVSPLSAQQRRTIVDTCARELLTSFGLRSLAPSDANYLGTYGGSLRERDAAYHQGTAWGWLIGPFALAHFRAYGDAAAALAFLEPMRDQLEAYGLGSAGEIADGDPPHRFDGCIAQAWTIGEVLRVDAAIRSGAVVSER